MNSLDETISDADIIAVMTQMGYRLLQQRDGFQVYAHADLINPFFLDVGISSQIPKDLVDQMLSANGINLDAFYAILESF